MSTQSAGGAPGRDSVAGAVPPHLTQTDGLGSLAQPDDETNKRLNEIEMMGEEEAVGHRSALPPAAHHGITPGMRFLHSSRTINQLVIDRNRCVTIYLAVASLLWTATGALLHAQPKGDMIVPIEDIQRWSIPATSGTLTVLAVLVALLLVRIRVGLIYEVAKMNVLLGLPFGRVRRVNPLSVFFIMYAMVSMAGGGMGVILCYHLLRWLDLPTGAGLISLLVGVVIAALLIALYVGAVRYLTADPVLLARAGESKPHAIRPAMGSVIY